MVYNNNRDQLIEKNIGKGASGKYLQSIDYGYNTRGWLTAINSVNVGLGNIAITHSGVTVHWFGVLGSGKWWARG